MPLTTITMTTEYYECLNITINNSVSLNIKYLNIFKHIIDIIIINKIFKIIIVFILFTVTLFSFIPVLYKSLFTENSVL